MLSYIYLTETFQQIYRNVWLSAFSHIKMNQTAATKKLVQYFWFPQLGFDVFVTYGRPSCSEICRCSSRSCRCGWHRWCDALRCASLCRSTLLAFRKPCKFLPCHILANPHYWPASWTWSVRLGFLPECRDSYFSHDSSGVSSGFFQREVSFHKYYTESLQ